MSMLSFSARNFRKLRQFDWSPEGLSLVVGSNGAGKTTVLDLLRFLRSTFVHGHEAGFIAVGGGDHFPSGRTFGPDFMDFELGADELVEFKLSVGDIHWKLRLPMSQAGLKGTYGEELYRGSELILRSAAYGERWFLGTKSMPLDETRCCAKVLWDRGEAPWMEPLVRCLYDLRTYDFYLNLVREGSSREENAAFLHRNGKNLWAVLANWKSAPLRFRGQFDWVIDQAHRAFPDLVGNIEFDRNEAYIFPPGATDPADGLPPRRQPDGLLTGLLQLTAIMGAKPGSILAFDEIENQLHPHAIRSILAAMREQVETRQLTILLTTHSPVVLNDLRDEPESVYVLNHGDPEVPNPGRMSDLHHEDWLAQAKLGTLYERLAFGAPAGIGGKR